ncbi:MAG: peptidylprolyl isomerase [Halomonas subglaciescola]|nr:peptidylprolyl isomerase [Halomonas subglaciescola]
MTTTTPWRLRATLRSPSFLPRTLALSSALTLCLGAGALPLTASAQQADGGQPAFSSQRQQLDHVVAVVNDDAIMQSELDDRIAQVTRQAREQGGQLPERGELKEQVLERMVLENIQLQMARNAKLSVDDTKLNRQLRGIAESNGLSLEAFADRLEDEGTSLTRVREQVRREMLMTQVQQREVGRRVSINNRDVDQALEQRGGAGSGVIEEIRARHILIKVTPERNAGAAEALAQKTRRRIEQGDDFAAVAREVSDDEGSAINGGELGWVRPGQTVPAFEEAMKDLAIDQLSKPVRSRFGFHIIDVEERREKSVSQKEQREQARQAIFQRRANEEMDTWQREIRSEAFVDIRL